MKNVSISFPLGFHSFDYDSKHLRQVNFDFFFDSCDFVAFQSKLEGVHDYPSSDYGKKLFNLLVQWALVNDHITIYTELWRLRILKYDGNQRKWVYSLKSKNPHGALDKYLVYLCRFENINQHDWWLTEEECVIPLLSIGRNPGKWFWQ